MDSTALRKLSYGLYVIGTKDGDRNVGCVVNTVTQSTSQPVTLTVCIHKDNYTSDCIKRSGMFAISILSERAKESVLGIFGFSSSKDRDKFAEVPFCLTPVGMPYISEGVTGYLQCRVLNTIENFTHVICIAEVEEAENLSKEPPMTYAYYHSVIKGKTPEKASSYVKETVEMNPKKSYVCSVCGYEHPGSMEEFEDLPEDYSCPICGVGKELFVPAE